MNELLFPHLSEILEFNASRNLILAGGFGLYLKRKYLIESGSATLVRELPATRTTVDLDFFLKLDMFLNMEEGKAVRQILDQLKYSASERDWQFSKPLGSAYPERKVVVDLLARLPPPGTLIKVKSPRVGSGSSIGLHGRETPEAFAVEEQTITIEVTRLRSDGDLLLNSVIVPHPYAWLNMKVRAAHDWHLWRQGKEQRDRNEPRSPKHVFDACLITAMITEDELEQCKQISREFIGLGIANDIRDEAVRLFSTTNSAGWQEAVGQSDVGLDHALIWPTMVQIMGIE